MTWKAANPRFAVWEANSVDDIRCLTVEGAEDFALKFRRHWTAQLLCNISRHVLSWKRVGRLIKLSKIDVVNISGPSKF